jgi:hypothetical protein
MVVEYFLYCALIHDEVHAHLFLVQLLFGVDVEPISDRIPEIPFIDTRLVKCFKEQTTLFQVINIIHHIFADELGVVPVDDRNLWYNLILTNSLIVIRQFCFQIFI